MTEMSPPSFDRADEFGGIDHLLLPGQDPALLPGLLCELTAELQPGNVIERMWARDIALETVRAEYARMVDCAVQNHILEEARRKDGEAQDDTVPPQRKDRELAQAHIKHVALVAQLIEIVHSLLHERDRLIHQYDSRSNIVKAYADAMKLIEQQSLG